MDPLTIGVPVRNSTAIHSQVRFFRGDSCVHLRGLFPSSPQSVQNRCQVPRSLPTEPTKRLEKIEERFAKSLDDLTKTLDKF